MKLRRHRFLLSVLLLALCFALSSCSAAGFVPKSDTTWGELYRQFDSEEFSELDPQLQQMMDEAVLSQEVAENEAQPLTEVGSVAPIYPEEDAEEIEPVLDKAVFFFAEGMLSDESSITRTPSLSTLNVVSYPLPEEDGIRVDSYFYCPEKCPSICLVVFLQDPESGECVAFSSSDDFYYHEGLTRTASLCDLEEDFTGLESGRTYTIKARAFVLPPEGRTIEGSLYTEASLATL